jgi:hypothetical protein
MVKHPSWFWVPYLKDLVKIPPAWIHTRSEPTAKRVCLLSLPPTLAHKPALCRRSSPRHASRHASRTRSPENGSWSTAPCAEMCRVGSLAGLRDGPHGLGKPTSNLQTSTKTMCRQSCDVVSHKTRGAAPRIHTLTLRKSFRFQWSRGRASTISSATLTSLISELVESVYSQDSSIS